MTQPRLFERPVALNRNNHKDLHIFPIENHFAFSSHFNALPLVATEMMDAAKDYPIVFLNSDEDRFGMAVLVGLRDKENLMVDDKGRWTRGSYVPAFVRQYPFVLVTDESNQQLTVCLDEVYEGLSKEKGQKLFDENGNESEYLKNVLHFMRAVHDESQKTIEFAKRLKELGLLVPKVIHIDPPGIKQTVEGFWVVDAQKLNGIDDARVLELHHSGYLTWIYAHLISLGTLPNLVNRLEQRAKPADQTNSTADAESPKVTH
jgi:hypothetical protein